MKAPSTRRAKRGLLFLILLTSAAAAPAQQVSFEYLGKLGLTDAEHTDSSGTQFGNLTKLSRSGYAIGDSRRANGSGISVWISEPSGAVHRAGFFDAAHTGADGYQQSAIFDVSESGFAVGSSQRLGTGGGQSAWMTDPSGSSIRLGYSDAAHTRADGYQFSQAARIAGADRTIGYSYRFNGSDLDATTVWISDSSGSLTAVGLMDSEHTRADGVRDGRPFDVTDSGYVVGQSTRFIGSEGAGYSVWVMAPDGVTRRIGLFGDWTTRSDGKQFSEVLRVNEEGYVIGYSYNFPDGGGANGLLAWVADPQGNSTEVGLMDLEHTWVSRVGIRAAIPVDVNASGKVAGYSLRFDNEGGQSGWASDANGPAVRLGFIDAEHIRADGYRYSVATGINDDGWVVGWSRRYVGMADAGYSAWVVDPSGQTIRIGLLGPERTRADGVQFSYPGKITNAGLVSGYSSRVVGATAWIYDIHDGVTTSFDLSVQTSTGAGESWISDIDENGWAIGGYQKFGDDGEDLGYRAFTWHKDLGVFDIGEYMDVSASDAGWHYLGSADFASAGGLIAGWGVRTVGESDSVFLVKMHTGGFTPSGDDVEVAPEAVDDSGNPVANGPMVTMTFEAVSGGGTTTATVTQNAPALPSGFVLGTPSYYVDITTTSTFNGVIELCIDYANVTFAGDPANLRLYHYENGVWTDVTTSNDTVARVICGQVTSLSPFAIVEQADPIAMLDELVQAVAALNAKKGIINSLDAKLSAAKQALTDAKANNDRAAINVLLSAFIGAVEAQSGNQLLVSEADGLIKRAGAISRVLAE